MRFSGWAALVGVLVLTAGQSLAQAPAKSAQQSAGTHESLKAWYDPTVDRDPFPSTYRAQPSGVIAITNARILTAHGSEIPSGTVLINDGKIVAVGDHVDIPAGAKVIDGTGKWVTPGIIDAHSHLAAAEIPVGTLADGLNEMTDPNSAQIFVEHDLWPQSPAYARARAAGVTTLQVLPGSANLFGGRTVVLKNVDAVTVQAMKFPGAPYGVKMACGENPIRVYGPKGRAPYTRAADMAGYRAAFADAADYARRWDDYHAKVARGQNADPPKRDIKLDTLMGILNGEISIQEHCYRAEEMAEMIDIAKEFGIHVRAFHHATEAFKIVPLLVKEGVCILTWGGYKMEAYDFSGLEVGMIDRAGGCVAVVSDSELVVQHLNIDAGRSMAEANRAGLGVTRADAIKWVTINPATAIGVGDKTGSLEPGKMADVVIWNTDPFSVYAHPEVVLVDGVETYKFGDPRYDRPSDFEIGQAGRRYEQ